MKVLKLPRWGCLGYLPIPEPITELRVNVDTVQQTQPLELDMKSIQVNLTNITCLRK